VAGHPNIFALGDACNVPEEKLAYLAQAHGALVAGNIAALAAARGSSGGAGEGGAAAAPKLAAWRPGFGLPGKVMIVSLGRRCGVAARGAGEGGAAGREEVSGPLCPAASSPTHAHPSPHAPTRPSPAPTPPQPGPHPHPTRPHTSHPPQLGHRQPHMRHLRQLGGVQDEEHGRVRGAHAAAGVPPAGVSGARRARAGAGRGGGRPCAAEQLSSAGERLHPGCLHPGCLHPGCLDSPQKPR
jgi:hypothetical protein